MIRIIFILHFNLLSNHMNDVLNERYVQKYRNNYFSISRARLFFKLAFLFIIFATTCNNRGLICNETNGASSKIPLVLNHSVLSIVIGEDWSARRLYSITTQTVSTTFLLLPVIHVAASYMFILIFTYAKSSVTCRGVPWPRTRHSIGRHMSRYLQWLI